MKRNIIISLTIAIVFCVSYCEAKSSIGAVYGVTLGDSESSVMSYLKSQGKTGSWKKTSSGISFYQIKSVSVGNVQFAHGNFFFTNGKLTKVAFGSSSYGSRNPDFQGYDNDHTYESTQSNASLYRQKFNQMYSNLKGKYGAPSESSEDEYVWTDGKNSILLRYSYEENRDYGYLDTVNTLVSLVYSTPTSSSNSNSNF